MDARDNDSSPADALLDDHCCGFTGADPFPLVFRKYAIAFDGSRIIIIDDGAGAGTGQQMQCSAGGSHAGTRS